MRVGRVVVVTGAAGGIGQLVAERFLANGDTVIATDIAEPALGKLTAAQAQDAKLHVVAADISNEADCAAVAACAENVAGRVDVLVNVAGWFPIQPFEKMSAADFRRVVDVNLTGPFLMIKAVWPLMQGRDWGRIVTIGSASTFEGVPDQVHYVAAKAGLFGLTRSLARVAGSQGITVNLVTPGLTETEPVKQHMPAAMLERAVEARALGRAEQPADLVGAVFFLASPDADFITGQTLNVDGGSHMV